MPAIPGCQRKRERSHRVLSHGQAGGADRRPCAGPAVGLRRAVGPITSPITQKLHGMYSEGRRVSRDRGCRSQRYRRPVCKADLPLSKSPCSLPLCFYFFIYLLLLLLFPAPKQCNHFSFPSSSCGEAVVRGAAGYGRAGGCFLPEQNARPR